MAAPILGMEGPCPTDLGVLSISSLTRVDGAFAFSTPSIRLASLHPVKPISSANVSAIVTRRGAE